MSIRLIVAINHQRVIGINNTLPWHLPDDLRYFKRITQDSVIIMGRKTYASIGRPLPNRSNIVLTRDPNYLAPGCTIMHTLTQAIKHAKTEGKPVFIIGGAELYAQALPLCQTLYLTVIDNHDQGDTLFPESLTSLQQQGWLITNEEPHVQDAEHAYAFTWYVLEKTQK